MQPKTFLKQRSAIGSQTVQSVYRSILHAALITFADLLFRPTLRFRINQAHRPVLRASFPFK